MLLRRIMFGLAAFGLVLIGLYILANCAFEGAAHSHPVQAIYVAPGILCLLVAAVLQTKSGRWKRRIIISACVAAVLAGATAWALYFNQNLCYRDSLAAWQHREGNLTSHFPRTIPPGATQVFIHAESDRPLGASVFDLSYCTTPEKVRAIDQRFRALAEHSSNGTGDWMDKSSPEHPPIYFHTTEWPEGKALPSDFRVYTLHSEGWGDFRLGHDNGGRAYGVAVSTKRNEVIYWATEWFIS